MLMAVKTPVNGKSEADHKRRTGLTCIKQVKLIRVTKMEKRR
ncbi:hypothetical protein SAMN05216378_1318 [Paenibacillus catalpae]|uniref:Uncharacterized protein n=1 Tax=Paenibacillus catalpae TaxID=1045775 RepID=A0A1I1UZT0_9BACL|nr:hypothetical protein SAMN05216378_1318 [Paenibacillus catalpae]